MPYPKGIKIPEIRAVWVAERRQQIQAFDQLVGDGIPRYKAAQILGRNVSSIDAMRRSVEQLEESGVFKGAAGRSYIDLGLSLLTCLRKPGETLTAHDIAAWCGCSRAAIQRIEKRALDKIRRRLVEFAIDQELDQEVKQMLSRGPELVAIL